jgi:hypothetical protein
MQGGRPPRLKKIETPVADQVEAKEYRWNYH